jgi:hypothetical protein
MQVLMPTRILGNARDDLEPESEIKPEPILKQPDLCGGWIRSYD